MGHILHLFSTDNEAPVFTYCPPDMDVFQDEDSIDGTAIVEWLIPEAIDNDGQDINLHQVSLT